MHWWRRSHVPHQVPSLIFPAQAHQSVVQDSFQNGKEGVDPLWCFPGIIFRPQSLIVCFWQHWIGLLQFFRQMMSLLFPDGV